MNSFIPVLAVKSSPPDWIPLERYVEDSRGQWRKTFWVIWWNIGKAERSLSQLRLEDYCSCIAKSILVCWREESGYVTSSSYNMRPSFIFIFQGKAASMGIAEGSQPLPFGHSAQAAVDIEGLVVSITSICYPILWLIPWSAPRGPSQRTAGRSWRSIWRRWWRWRCLGWLGRGIGFIWTIRRFWWLDRSGQRRRWLLEPQWQRRRK